MSDSRFYETDPTDPDAPVVLPEWDHPTGLVLRPGQTVRYVNPFAAALDGPLVVTELLRFDAGDELPHVVAILNDGEYEVDASNLIPETCEDRGYACCNLMPPPEGFTPEEYGRWYDAHVENYSRAQETTR